MLHYGRPGTLEELVPGMIFTIEPMINAGKRDIKEDRRGNRPYDGWTIVTKDRSLSAQWEHTVLVTETGYEVLTVSAGSPPPPAFQESGVGSPAGPPEPPCPRRHDGADELPPVPCHVSATLRAPSPRASVGMGVMRSRFRDLGKSALLEPLPRLHAHRARRRAA